MKLKCNECNTEWLIYGMSDGKEVEASKITWCPHCECELEPIKEEPPKQEATS